MPDIFVSKQAQPAPASPKATGEPLPTLASGKPMPFFATMFKNPRGVTFASQDPDETVLLFLRRDFITNFLWIFIAAVLFTIPPVFHYLNTQFGVTLFTFPQNYTVVLLSFYDLLILGYALFNFLSWFYNVSLLTNEKVVDIDYINLLSKKVAETTYAEVSNVHYQQNGFLQSFFNYGTVTIQTQDPNGDILFESIPNPGDVSRMINDIKEGDPNA